MHINLVRHKISSGDLVLINPTPLQVGRARFREKDGSEVKIEVVKFKHL